MSAVGADRSYPIEGLLKIRDQERFVFDADGKANQVFTHTGLVAIFRAEAHMRIGDGLVGQAGDAAKAGGQLDLLQAVHYPFCTAKIGGDLEQGGERFGDQGRGNLASKQYIAAVDDQVHLTAKCGLEGEAVVEQKISAPAPAVDFWPLG